MTDVKVWKCISVDCPLTIFLVEAGAYLMYESVEYHVVQIDISSLQVDNCMLFILPLRQGLHRWSRWEAGVIYFQSAIRMRIFD